MGHPINPGVSNTYMHSYISHRVFLSALLISLLSHKVFACQCGGGGVSPCASLSNYSSIFLGTVESVENRPLKEFLSFAKLRSAGSLRDQYAVFRDEIIVNFSVQETFKGSNSANFSPHNKIFRKLRVRVQTGRAVFRAGQTIFGICRLLVCRQVE